MSNIPLVVLSAWSDLSRAAVNCNIVINIFSFLSVNLFLELQLLPN